MGALRKAVAENVMVENLHIMGDIETLGTRSGFVVTEIALGLFDENFQILEEFHLHLQVEDQVHEGLEICEDTLKWRLEQDLPYKIFLGEKHLPHMVLFAVDTWLMKVRAEYSVDLGDLVWWARGGMDQAMLEGLAAVYEWEMPWKYSQWRDQRTVCKMAGYRVPQASHVGIEDVRQQVADLKEAYQILKLEL